MLRWPGETGRTTVRGRGGSVVNLVITIYNINIVKQQLQASSQAKARARCMYIYLFVDYLYLIDAMIVKTNFINHWTTRQTDKNC